MLIYKGKIIAGGGTIVMPMTRAEYEENKTVLNSADVWVDLTDEPDSVADGECIQYDSDMNFEDIGNIATKAIAKVEPSDTARYLHPVGEGFINKDGNYCITDVQISVGGTITLGTNCHVVDGGISNNLTALVETDQIVLNCTTAGENTFNRNDILNPPQYAFSSCIFQIVNYQATPHVSTLTVNGSNSIIINASVTGNHYVRWWHFNQP